jgi:DNA-binding transcriptional MerR regulator
MGQSDGAEGKSIGEVAALLGVSAMTIRSWERRYAWPRPTRTSGSHRRYSDEEIERLRALAELRRSMPTGAAIKRLKLLGDERR